MDAGMYSHETIWDRLQAASVNARYYYVDTPWLALWGNRLFDRISPINDYFADAAAGTLPRPMGPSPRKSIATAIVLAVKCPVQAP